MSTFVPHHAVLEARSFGVRFRGLGLLAFGAWIIMLLNFEFAIAQEAVTENAAENAIAETAPATTPDSAVDITTETEVDENGELRRPKPRRKVTETIREGSKFTSDKTEREADRRSELLAVGVDKIVDIDPSINVGSREGSVMVSNTSVVVAQPVKVGQRFQLVLKGQGEGFANITIRDTNGNVRIIIEATVAKQNLVRYYERLKDKLKEVEGITFAVEDQKVVIRGEVYTINDYGTIVNEIAEKTYGDAVINKATMSIVSLNLLAKRIEQDVQVFAPTVTATAMNGRIILGGSVESQPIRIRAATRAEYHIPVIRVSDPIASAANIEKNDKPLQIIQNDIQVNPPPPKRDSKLVRLGIYFVELSKDFLKSFGFKWQPGFTADPSISIGANAAGGTTTSNAGGFTFSGTLSSLFPALNAPPSNAGYGRILKQANLVVKSEQQGTLRDEQTIPTQQLGPNGTVGAGQSITVGFVANITPTILQGQDVDLNISISQVNALSKTLAGQPYTAKHEVNTRLYLKSGEVAAVAAVNSQDFTTAFNRDDPNAGSFQGQTRPLFTLQRSKSSSNKRGQFVVFVSPQIIDSASEGTEDLKKNFRMKTAANQ
jgi:pilus assembly protein CpaC